jgi:mRNA interferase MazF
VIVARKAYFPDSGDLVHLNFSPSAGHEHAGPHYALALSTAAFAKATGYALFCPITSRIRNWPFEVRIPAGVLPPKQGTPVDSVLLTDQIKSLDYRDRNAIFVAKAPDAVLDAVLDIVRAILDADDVMDEL